MAESNLLRAEAAIERHLATSVYSESFQNDDLEWNKRLHQLTCDKHEANAALLEAQSDWVLHAPEEGK